MYRVVLLAVALALAALLVPGFASAGETTIIPAEGRPAADQATAILSARQLIAAGQLDEAVGDLADFVASHPAATDAARFLGDLYYRQGHLDRAEAVYKQLLGLNPRDKETHNRLGAVYAAENRLDDAIRQFNSALPGTDSIRDLVMAHMRKGDFAQYQTEMERAAAAQPTDSDIQEEVGEIYYAIARPAEAVTYFKRALDNDATSIAAINGLGMAELDLHEYSDAENNFQQCLGLDPINYACTDNVGAVYLETKRYADAQSVLDRAHGLAPERPEAIVNFGFLADVRGDWKRAVAYYVQASTLDPYLPASYIDLGIDYEHNGLYTLAQAALLRGIAAAPYDGRIRYLLATAYAEQGQTSLALQQLKLAEESFDPDIAQIAREERARLAGSAATAPQ